MFFYGENIKSIVALSLGTPPKNVSLSPASKWVGRELQWHIEVHAEDVGAGKEEGWHQWIPFILFSVRE